MASETAAAWDRFAAEYQRQAQLSTVAAQYGPDIPTEADLRLLGDVKGRRVLELGCGAAQCSIAFAKAGAIAIGVDFSAEQLGHARQLCDREEVKVDLRLADMADLAFLRADSVDAAFSSYAFNYVEDLGRVFRQVHRVLKVGAPLVFSLPHPAYFVMDEDSAPPVTERSYFDRSPERFQWGGVGFTGYHHTFADLYMGLVRASYRVDLVVEPEPIPGAPRSWFWHDAMDWLPRTLIVRARKEGN
ncbi:MAG: methyltransferase domain-containing protein [Acidimicrobiales bacterium]|nr:methyltransferase domain-containing protein [Acidimicrobiales bacterium]